MWFTQFSEENFLWGRVTSSYCAKHMFDKTKTIKELNNRWWPGNLLFWTFITVEDPVSHHCLYLSPKSILSSTPELQILLRCRRDASASRLPPASLQLIKSFAGMACQCRSSSIQIKKETLRVRFHELQLWHCETLLPMRTGSFTIDSGVRRIRSV